MAAKKTSSSQPNADANGQADSGRKFHRFDEVRQDERITKKDLAKRLGVNGKNLNKLLDPTYDAKLSEVEQWANALDAQTGDLLIDGQEQTVQALDVHLVKWKKLFLSAISAHAKLQTIRDVEEESLSALLSLYEMFLLQLIQIEPELLDLLHIHGTKALQERIQRLLEG